MNLDEKLIGSITETAYVPLTALDWTTADEVRFVLREVAGSSAHGAGDGSQKDVSDKTRMGPSSS